MLDMTLSSRKPLISVLIPNYNSPDLYAALDSVLIQDYPNLQLILIDDASDSFSANEFEEYIKTNIKGRSWEWCVLVNSVNQGTVRTMNRAFSLAHGEYIFNLAGDDAFYDGHVLSDWVTEFQRTDAQIITAKRMCCDSTLNREFGTAPDSEQIRKIQEYTPWELFEAIGPVNFIFGCCTARSAECMRRYGTCSDLYRLIDDHPLNLRLLRENVRIVFFDRVVIKYRVGGVSSAGRHNAQYRAEARLIQRCEVQPYTNRSRQAWKIYRQWERSCRREALRRKWGGNRLAWFWMRGWLYMLYPESTIQRLKGILKLDGSIYKKGDL